MKTRSVTICLAALFVLKMCPLSQAQDQTAAFAYWHIWTGKDGKSHLTKCMMTNFMQQGVNKQLQIKQPGNVNIIFAYNPKGGWHENPRVQWVVPLQGSFFLEAQDGTQVTLAPGSLLLGEDLGTTPDLEGHKGHISANKGNEPLVLLISQLDVAPTLGEPCHIR